MIAADAKLRVSPLLTVFDAVSAPDHQQFPLVDASQIEIWVTVVVPNAHAVQVAADVDALAPPDAAPNVIDTRAAEPTAAVVPASPGSAVWSWT